MTTLSVTQKPYRIIDNELTEVADAEQTRLLHGNLEGVVRGRVTGWVLDSLCTGDGIPVEVFEHNRLVAAGLADRRRVDLVEAGYRSGAFGFELPIDPAVLDGQEHELRVRHAEQCSVVATQCVRVSPFARSSIHGIDAGVISGQIELLEAATHTGFDIEVLADGETVAEGTCALETSGAHFGFSAALPASLFDDNPHVFSVRLKGLLTAQQPHWERLPSIHTPWIYLSDSGVDSRLSAMSKVAAFRYAALQTQLSQAAQCLHETGTAQRLADIKQAHDVLVEGYENRTQYPVLCLPEAAEPKVSLVIPVHEKFSLTYHCLASLILSSNQCSFEVIVVDDKSSDETVSIGDYVKNVHCVRNSTNLGFLLSSKAGAHQARGEFIVFLNNDTEVTTGWLDALLEAFDTYASVGMAGSKLIYPNGKLQEAGGIVWGNGQPWNIGNSQNAEHPMYNYTRQTDYLSGAAMMVRRDVWEAIDGFSEEMVPAYYEDTDLAFKVREAGYKTLYCPFSTVIHFEGMSNGRDINAGIKRLQSVNAPKFRAKWRHAYRHNGQEGRQLSIQLDRGVDFRALVVDYATPRPDHDAGGYAAVQEMQLLQELGCKVTFIPNNMAHMGRHTEALQKKGIECIHAPFYTSIGGFLSERGADYDLVYITRYDIAEQVVPSVRQFTQAKIVFNNADLHFLRELRAALVCGEESLEAPLRTRERELQVMREVDAVLSYNEVEHSVITSHNLTEENVFKCPWVLQDRRSTVPFEQREGIAFLGGFNHQPNREAVKYFVESVMPLLRIVQPGLKLHVYGSKVTTDIETLACDDVVIEGYVESLSKVFDTCRVFVAPLLSGAGIKGKVLESIAYGIPCVLSPVAAEATGLLHGHSTLIANNPEQWSQHISELYTNSVQWQHMADKAHELVGTLYSYAEGLAKMQEVMRYVELEPAERREVLFRNKE